jgi:integrase
MGQPKKRGDKYYANTRVNGIRLRDCLETDNWQEALKRQKALVEKAEKRILQPSTPATRSLATATVSEALDALIAQRSSAPERYSANTVQLSRERARPLKRILGQVKVKQIDIDAFLSYRKQRRSEGVANRTINMETSLLTAVLKKAKRWHFIEDQFREAEEKITLPERKGVVGKALTLEEKRRLFMAARSKPEWYRALFAAVIAVSTTARKVEVLNTKRKDVSLIDRIWRITRSKTEKGHRTIVLNDEALHAFAEMLRIGEGLGSNNEDDYVFGTCENRRFDFTQPQKSIRTSWRKLTLAADLKGFRFHDLRHSAITELVEGGVPDSVVQSLAGHVSKEMQEHYTHVRNKAKEKAVSLLGGTGLLPEKQEVTPPTVAKNRVSKSVDRVN